MRTYDQVKNAVLSKNYKWFEGELNLNCVWERTSYNYTNIFDDHFYICYQQGGVNKVLEIDKATTKPGLESAQMPRIVDGVTGVAVILPGQYSQTWEFYDGDKLAKFASENHKIYPFNYPHFRQIKNVNYWRDPNKDNKIDKVQEQDNKLYFTHWHCMSNPNTYGSGLVKNWSEGCMGWPQPEFVKFYSLIKDSIKVWGDKFTGTLLESSDFK